MPGNSWRIPLSSVTPANAVKIFQKVDLRLFFRLQRTCRGIGEFIEQNPFKVNFHQLGLLFSASQYVTIFYINRNGEPIDVFTEHEENRIIRVERWDQVGTMFDGFVFGSIRIEVCQHQTATVLEFLRTHKISSVFLTSKHITFEETQPFIRMIKPAHGLFEPNEDEDFAASLCSFRLKQAGLLVSNFPKTVGSLHLLLENIPEIRLTCYFQATTAMAIQMIAACLQVLVTDVDQLKTFRMDCSVSDVHGTFDADLVSTVQNITNIRLAPRTIPYTFIVQSFNVKVTVIQTALSFPRSSRLSLQMDVNRR